MTDLSRVRKFWTYLISSSPKKGDGSPPAYLRYLKRMREPSSLPLTIWGEMTEHDSAFPSSDYHSLSYDYHYYLSFLRLYVANAIGLAQRNTSGGRTMVRPSSYLKSQN
jgi:hypothetical protein